MSGTVGLSYSRCSAKASRGAVSWAECRTSPFLSIAGSFEVRRVEVTAPGASPWRGRGIGGRCRDEARALCGR